MLQRIINYLPNLWSNWLGLVGTALTTISANVMLIFFIVDLFNGVRNAYAQTLAYLLMPLLFIFGLLLVAIGSWRATKQRKTESSDVIRKAIDTVMEHPPTRRRLWFVVIGTFLNVTIISVVAYKGITYTDSVTFCGQLCHSVMAPEYSSYKRSPHARVPCARCHIGEGASWFVRSKLSGLRQVWAVMTEKYSQPIQTPLHDLRPARETCEQCHWPAKFHGTRLLVRHTFQDDEQNTRQTNVVRLKVGGMDKRSGRYTGIHWHVSPNVKITYEALDRKRAKIGKVTVEETGKGTRVFRVGKGKDRGKGKDKDKDKDKGKAARVFERRVMDCLDCHNRPSHTFDPLPRVAVDNALSYGKLPSLPYMRREAVKLLKDVSRDPEQAAKQYTAALSAFYGKNYPEVARKQQAAIAKAGRELAWIYRRNIFPSMKIGWNTYPLHLGHRSTTEGCFRCHDDEHEDRKGETIPQDCDKCHEVLAEEEEKPDLPASMLKLGRM